MKHLRIRDLGVGDAWRIRVPIWPWEYRAAEQARASLLARLVTMYPFQALWRSTWGTNLPYWTHYSPTQPFDSQDEDGWGYFSLTRTVGLSSRISNRFRLTVKACYGEGLLKILDSLSAKAGVVSGYDGNEWLVGGVPANQAIAS